MKKIIVLIISCIFPFLSFSQSLYHQMLEKNKAWVYDRYIPSHDIDDFHTEQNESNDLPNEVRFILEGDTIINGLSYLKLIKHEKGFEPMFFYALRESGTTICCIKKGSTQEFVLQELDVTQFPTEFTELYGKYKQVTDTIIVQGEKYVRHIYTPEEWWAPHLRAVEGMGYANYGIVYGMFPEPMPLSENADYFIFKGCEKNHELIFNNTDFYSTTTTAIENSIIQDRKQIREKTFDLQGRPLSTPPSRGIYIQNGKKVIK